MPKRYAAVIQEDEAMLKEYDSFAEYEEDLKRSVKIQIAVLIDLLSNEIYVYDGRKKKSTPFH